ncbi:MAG: Ribonuclease R, partial [Alphaproteobacteria bacterium MarineAlpha2_Bin1]
FNQIISKYNEKKILNLINVLVLRCQSQANYSYKNIGHFGLSLKAYTHFTSPIRRYSDLIIHRSILNEINIEKNKITDETLALQISQIERNNTLVERSIYNIYSTLFLSKKIGENFDAYITSVKKYGVFISLKNYNVEGLVRKQKLDRNFLLYDNENNLFFNKKSKVVLKLGDYIKVKLVEANILFGHLSFERVI